MYAYRMFGGKTRCLHDFLLEKQGARMFFYTEKNRSPIV